MEIEDDQLAHMYDDAPIVEGYPTGAVPLEGKGKLVWCELPLPNGVTADRCGCLDATSGEANSCPNRLPTNRPAQTPVSSTVSSWACRIATGDPPRRPPSGRRTTVPALGVPDTTYTWRGGMGAKARP